MSKPDCFGNLWSAKATECRGGYDPTFTGADGSNVRPACDFFHSCGAQKSSKEVSQRMQVPLSNLTSGIRPVSVTSSGPKRPSFLPTVPSPVAQAQAQARALMPSHEVIQMQPVEMVPSNWYTVPSMLATLEPMEQFTFRNAALTAGRGAAVGALMSLAHFISNAPFNPKPKGGG